MRYGDEDIVAVVEGAADGNGGAVGREDCTAAGDEEGGCVLGVGVLSAMVKPEKTRSVFELGVANLLSVIPCWGGRRRRRRCHGVMAVGFGRRRGVGGRAVWFAVEG